MLFIPKLEQNIQNQLNNLYQIAEANRDKADDEKDKKMQGAFTVIAILSIFSALIDSYDFLKDNPWFSSLPLLSPISLFFSCPLWWIVLILVLAIVLITFEWWYEGYFFRSLWKSIKERWKKSKDKKKTKGDKK
jgi:magnesium-transporting ATPase (P-type)